MSLFLVISFQTPLKNPSRRAGGTKASKASGFVPPTLWVGFLRGVITLLIEAKSAKVQKMPKNVSIAVFFPVITLSIEV